MNLRNLLHSTVYCSTFSLCGKYLAVGTNFGDIVIFNVARILQSAGDAETAKLCKPVRTFSAHSGPVYSLISSSSYLISGGLDQTSTWKWEDLTNTKSEAREFEVFNRGHCATCLAIDSKTDQLFIGSENSIVSVWDIHTAKETGKFSGHSQYIHDVALLPNSLATASEDGTVKIWDCRSFLPVKSIQPSLSKEISRPKHGSWIKCLDVDSSSEWLVCGGGPMTSLWHIRSTSLVLPAMETPKDSSKFIPHSLQFFKDEIVGVGNQPYLHRWKLNANHKASIPCKLHNIFSIAFSGRDGKKTSTSTYRHWLRGPVIY